MTTSIADSIANHTNIFRRLLGMEEICPAELITELDHITEELSGMIEIAKTYSREEAKIDLEPHHALIRIVAEFQEKIEPSNYLNNKSVELSLARVWRAMSKLADEISDAVHLNRKSDRDLREALAKSRMCSVCPFKIPNL